MCIHVWDNNCLFVSTAATLNWRQQLRVDFLKILKLQKSEPARYLILKQQRKIMCHQEFSYNIWLHVEYYRNNAWSFQYRIFSQKRSIYIYRYVSTFQRNSIHMHKSRSKTRCNIYNVIFNLNCVMQFYQPSTLGNLIEIQLPSMILVFSCREILPYMEDAAVTPNRT